MQNTSNPRLIGEDEDLFLTILASRTTPTRYSARFADASSGSESDGEASTLGELVNHALDWAGVRDFSVATHGAADSIRSELKAAGDRVAFDFEVRLYTEF